MGRYMTLARIFLILFIINFARAAPVIVRRADEVQEVHVNVVDVADSEGGAATSQKRSLLSDGPGTSGPSPAGSTSHSSIPYKSDDSWSSQLPTDNSHPLSPDSSSPDHVPADNSHLSGSDFSWPGHVPAVNSAHQAQISLGRPCASSQLSPIRPSFLLAGQCASPQISPSFQLAGQCASPQSAPVFQLAGQCASPHISPSFQLARQCASPHISPSFQLAGQCASPHISPSFQLAGQSASPHINPSFLLAGLCASPPFRPRRTEPVAGEPPSAAAPDVGSRATAIYGGSSCLDSEPLNPASVSESEPANFLDKLLKGKIRRRISGPGTLNSVQSEVQAIVVPRS
ncbi:hypothetical protein BGY98DRAFT_622750 [Russula aff. rugulosa BPL654]|nr:hypothetical protein BGY98DRAFT_622750 [Russula aff. rugulosa BPL654]